jgi:hypothetical protein
MVCGTQPASVAARGRTHGRAERVGQLLDDREVLRGADPAAAGDDDRRVGEGRSSALLLDDGLLDHGRLGGVGERDWDGNDLGGAVGRRGHDGVGAQGDHRHARRYSRVHADRPAEHGLLHRTVRLDPDGVGEDPAADLERQPGGDLLVVPSGRQQHGSRTGLRHEDREHLSGGRHKEAGEVVALGRVDLGRAVGCERLAQRLRGAGSAQHDRAGLAQRASGGEQFERGLLDRAVGVVDENQYLSHELG